MGKQQHNATNNSRAHGNKHTYMKSYTQILRISFNLAYAHFQSRFCVFLSAECLFLVSNAKSDLKENMAVAGAR